MITVDDLLNSGIDIQTLDASQLEELLRVLNRQNDSKGLAKNIPNWATWIQEDWQTYFDANLSDAEVDLIDNLPKALIMLKRQNLVIENLAKMIIAIRDSIWPDLPE